MSEKSTAEETLALQLRGLKQGDWIREYKFALPRRWRFDFAHLERMIAIEVEGGIYVQGRHTRGAGFEADLEKYQEAMRLGWNVYRVSPRMVKRGDVIQTIEILFGMSQAKQLNL